MSFNNLIKVSILLIGFIISQASGAESVKAVQQKAKKATAAACAAGDLSIVKDSLIDDPSGVSGQSIILSAYVGNFADRLNAALSCVANIQSAVQPTNEDANHQDVIAYKKQAQAAADSLQGT